MELEFDKEIDALLRKARPPGAVPSGGHLDADAISAFAEGAVPAAARMAYTAHFAGCDRCRKALSQVALLSEREIAKAAASAAAPALAVRPTSTPWYRSLFRTPGLAAAMGVLVVAFAGVLVYLVTQRSPGADSTVAMEQRSSTTNAAVAYTGIDTNTTANSNSAIANTAATAAVSPNAVSNATRSANSAMNTPAQPVTGTASGSGSDARGGVSVDGLAAAPPPPAAAAAPPTGAVLAEKPKDEPKTAETTDTTRSRDDKETMRTEDRASSLAKRATGGPYRVQNQNQMQNNGAGVDAPVTRRVSGKTFRSADGAWYDSAYHGQTTTNVARGTDQFNKLDPTVRSIANELNGVVVLVWKDKAFRIQ